MIKRGLLFLLICVACFCFFGCEQPCGESYLTREETISGDAIKVLPQDDDFPPALNPAFSSMWENPVPVGGLLNSAGEEDSPFIVPNGNEMYFYFTPDFDIPNQDKAVDRVTGIWYSTKQDGTAEWGTPIRVVLQDSPCDPNLDGCEFVIGSTLWFVSMRLYGDDFPMRVYTAQIGSSTWTNVQDAGATINDTIGVGEFHISPDGQTMVFGGKAPGTAPNNNNLDIWKVEWTGTDWGTPEVLNAGINDTDYLVWDANGVDQNRPAMSADGKTLWWDREYTTLGGFTGPCIMMSDWDDQAGDWGPAQEVVSNFAGEPSLDEDGNLYFTHHHWQWTADMTSFYAVESDIYVCCHK